MLKHTATCCNTHCYTPAATLLQHTATHTATHTLFNTLSHTATHCAFARISNNTLERSTTGHWANAIHCNILQYAATHSNTMKSTRGIWNPLPEAFECLFWQIDTPLNVNIQVSLGTMRVQFDEVCVAVCCCVLQCVAVCCSVLQCVAVCCGVLLQRAARWSLAAWVKRGCTRFQITDLSCLKEA